MVIFIFTKKIIVDYSFLKVFLWIHSPFCMNICMNFCSLFNLTVEWFLLPWRNPCCLIKEWSVPSKHFSAFWLDWISQPLFLRRKQKILKYFFIENQNILSFQAWSTSKTDRCPYSIVRLCPPLAWYFSYVNDCPDVSLLLPFPACPTYQWKLWIIYE